MAITHVALGANSVRDYQFLAPLSALLWKDRIGFRPIVMTCDSEWANARGQVAAQALADHNIKRVHLESLKNFASHTLAQNCREYAACLEIPDDDWIMPSDADLWPIMKDFYQQHQKTLRGALYYANGDHFQTFPTCHITLRARDWRELGYGPVGANITEKVDSFVAEWLETDAKHWPWKDRNFAIWMSDQAGITDRLRRAPWFDALKPIERSGHPPVDRIDRGCWRDLRPDDVDAHIQRAPDEPGIWPNVFKLFSELLPEHAEWAKEYHRRYWEAYR